jgi:hypothetical protein
MGQQDESNRPEDTPVDGMGLYLATTAAASWTAQVLLEPVAWPCCDRSNSINAEITRIRRVELFEPLEEQNYSC